MDPDAAPVALERIEVALEPPRPALTLVRLVRGQLEDERTARKGGAERGPARHARRVDDVCACRAPGNGEDDRQMTDTNG